jgi:hypothetical protein
MWEQITDAIDLFRHLKESRLLSPNNFATLQAMIWHLGRKDLYRKFVDFCETRPSTLHFGAISGAGTAYPSRAPEFTPGF